MEKSFFNRSGVDLSKASAERPQTTITSRSRLTWPQAVELRKDAAKWRVGLIRGLRETIH